MFIILAIVGGLLGLCVILVLVLLYFGRPLPSIREGLATLPAEERRALESLCRAAGQEPMALRLIGGWTDSLMSSEDNRLSLGWQDGRIRGIRLAGQKLTTVPDLSGLAELEVLWLDGNQVASADLSGLSGLHKISLSHNRIASLARLRLPASLRRLDLSENEITDIGPLASLGSLTELDLSANRLADLSPLASLSALTILRLSANQVTAFDALLSLPFEKVDLRNNRVEAFPQALPKFPLFKANLDGNPVLNPPGYLRTRSYTIEGWTGDALKQRLVRSDPLEVSGTWQRLSVLRNVEIDGLKSRYSVARVRLEAAVKKGRLRLYLEEPDHFWSSPWIAKGLVEGFGLMRQLAWVYADADPAHPARLLGRPIRGGSRDRETYSFQMEPLDGPAEEISYRIYEE